MDARKSNSQFQIQNLKSSMYNEGITFFFNFGTLWCMWLYVSKFPGNNLAWISVQRHCVYMVSSVLITTHHIKAKLQMNCGSIDLRQLGTVRHDAPESRVPPPTYFPRDLATSWPALLGNYKMAESAELKVIRCVQFVLKLTDEKSYCTCMSVSDVYLQLLY